MILTVTVNPAIDQTIEVDRLVEGDTNRVAAIRWDVGGKGINVARVLKQLGYEPLACGFAPGELGRMIEDSLFDSAIGCEFIFVPGETRTNITILDRTTHHHTVLAAAGPHVTEHAKTLLRERLTRRLRPDSENWLVLAGSIPPGCGVELYVDLLTTAAERRAKTALDADGEVVAGVLTAGAAPDLLKLNQHEAERLLGRSLDSVEAALEGARHIRAWGVSEVVITLEERGSVAATLNGEYIVDSPQVEVDSAVGAGDAYLAGLLLGLVREYPWAQTLQLAAAAGAATCLTPGTTLCRADDVMRLRELVHVERVRQPAGV